ncbi:YqhA family protein [Hippea sp. KM1]|uniref:YqhA family protein n=1 Tax=Hippea sp. KM1 TaxID=944481 RepID=UPI00046D3FE3|nr:YqhA family protein [Hippea sp. KM1]
MDKRSKLEGIFEWLLWRSRLIVITAVIFGMIGAFIMFITASVDIWHTAKDTLSFFVNHYPEKDEFHSKLISQIIGAVDLYLIAVVMLIFSFGLYELFISDIDDAEDTKVGKRILSIHSLDELKDKIGKVVVMVLIVSFFKRMLHMHFDSPIYMLYFALCILALALSLYLMHKH